ncbi:MAG: hypothetical protein JWN78_2862, partial [Bacteroidota bacterium]|nr:hypothetical protein [Bacteroidota bacterium]
LSTEGSYIVFKSKGIPDHVSPYWQTSNPLYIAPASGHIKNPSYIGEQSFTMKILKTPQAATTQSATNMGPIGMAINGVAIYNNLEAGSIPIEAVTVTTFDTGGGHSGPGDLYHYHCEPTFISSNDSKLIGFLMDGYPIYGRKDMSGSTPSDLDANGGHFGTTADYPAGIYHYHCSNVNYLGSGYYILKSGNYYGVKGTFTY